ncbi:HupE/UreJ family protein [Vibrio viridaestus]|nr:HupE/UreJ family protein [Vibrio viridaestus]
MNSFGKFSARFSALMLLSAPVFAHPGHGEASFSTGFLHPLTGYDHLTALLLIGLFAAGYATKSAWKIIGCFALALIGGFAIGVEWADAHQAEALVSLSLLALPVAILAYRKKGIVKFISMAAIFAFSACHGLVQGAESVGSAAQFGLGSLVSSLMVITVVMLVSKAVKSTIHELKSVKAK